MASADPPYNGVLIATANPEQFEDYMEVDEPQVCKHGNKQETCSCYSNMDSLYTLREMIHAYAKVKRLEEYVKKPSFLITREQNELPTIQEMLGKDFKVIEVLNVNNCNLKAQYDTRKHMLESINKVNPFEPRIPGGLVSEGNEHVVYHATRGDLINICEEGLNPSYSRGGSYGKGIYFTDSAIKANDYSIKQLKQDNVRIMLQCRILLGRIKEYGLAQQDHCLMTAPHGYNSVKGFISRDIEYVIYQPDQILVEKIILYKCENKVLDIPPIIHIKFPFSGNGSNSENITYISFYLSMILNNLMLEASKTFNSPEHITIKKKFYALLKETITFDNFLDNISKILKRPLSPSEIKYLKYHLELNKIYNKIKQDPTSISSLPSMLAGLAQLQS